VGAELDHPDCFLDDNGVTDDLPIAHEALGEMIRGQDWGGMTSAYMQYPTLLFILTASFNWLPPAFSCRIELPVLQVAVHYILNYAVESRTCHQE
jgi:hypothetical protein